MSYEEVLAALADPTRRALLERMRRRPCTVGELAVHARIRQPTVSRHLQVLRDARLVSDRREGTRRYYSVSTEGLSALQRYVQSLWDDVLAAYAADDPAPPAKRARAKPSRGRR